MDYLLAHPEEDDCFFDDAVIAGRRSSLATEDSPTDDVASCDLGIATELFPLFPESPSECRLEDVWTLEVLTAPFMPQSQDASILSASNIAKSHQRGIADQDRPIQEPASVELKQDGARADCLESAESVKESSPYSGLAGVSHGNSAPLHSPTQPSPGNSVSLHSEVVSSIRRPADGSPEGLTDEVISDDVKHTAPGPRDGGHAEAILIVSTMSSLDVEGAGVGIAELWDPETRFQRPNSDGQDEPTLRDDQAHSNVPGGQRGIENMSRLRERPQIGDNCVTGAILPREQVVQSVRHTCRKYAIQDSEMDPSGVNGQDASVVARACTSCAPAELAKANDEVPVHVDNADKVAAPEQAEPVAQVASTDVTHTGDGRNNKKSLPSEEAVNVTEINTQRLLSERPSAGCCIMTAVEIPEDSNSDDPNLSAGGDDAVPSYQTVTKTAKKRKCHGGPETNQTAEDHTTPLHEGAAKASKRNLQGTNPERHGRPKRNCPRPDYAKHTPRWFARVHQEAQCDFERWDASMSGIIREMGHRLDRINGLVIELKGESKRIEAERAECIESQKKVQERQTELLIWSEHY